MFTIDQRLIKLEGQNDILAFSACLSYDDGERNVDTVVRYDFIEKRMEYKIVSPVK